MDRTLTAMTEVQASRQPLVSVIIPFRNAEAWIEQCCASVQDQTLKDWEALLINDGSTDRSRELAEAIACDDSRFVVLDSLRTQQHLPGPWLPRNRGLDEAQGRWVAFLDADDLWHPHKLSKQIAVLEEEAGDICASAYVRFDTAGGLIRARRVPPANISHGDLWASNPLPMSTVVVRKSVLGPCRFQAVCHEDHDLWQRLFSQQSLRYHAITQPLMAYRLHGANLTHGVANRVMMKWKSWRGNQQPLWWCVLQTTLQQMRYGAEKQRWRFRPKTVWELGFSRARRQEMGGRS